MDTVNSMLEIQRLVLVNLQVLHGEEGGGQEVESDANADFPFPRFSQKLLEICSTPQSQKPLPLTC